MKIGLSVGSRYSAVDISEKLLLGQAIEVRFHRRRRGIIVPMPSEGPLSRQQFQEIVELIAKEGQIDLEVVAADEYAGEQPIMDTKRLITRLQELGMLEPYPQEGSDEPI